MKLVYVVLFCLTTFTICTDGKTLFLKLRFYFDLPSIGQDNSKRNSIKEYSLQVVKECNEYFSVLNTRFPIKIYLQEVKFVWSSMSYMESDKNVDEYLSRFCIWQTTRKRNNKGRYYSVLFTGLDLYRLNGRREKVYELVGRAYSKAHCVLEFSCTVIEYSSDAKHNAYYLTHELGHSLGAGHDIKPGCNDNTIMTNFIYISFSYDLPNSWSNCSRKEIEDYLKKSTCFSFNPFKTKNPLKLTLFKVELE